MTLRAETYRVSLTDDHRVRIEFQNAAGECTALIEFDAFGARRLAHVLNELADVAVQNAGATRVAKTGRAKT